MIFFQVCVFFPDVLLLQGRREARPRAGARPDGARGAGPRRAPRRWRGCPTPARCASPRRPLRLGVLLIQLAWVWEGPCGPRRPGRAFPAAGGGRMARGGGPRGPTFKFGSGVWCRLTPRTAPRQPLVGGCMPRSMMRRRGGADTTAPHHSTVHKKSKSGARAGAGRGGAGLPFQSKFCAPLLCPPRTSPNLPTVNT